MNINKEFLKSLKPCADRYENYLEHHGEFNGSFNDFLDLPNISYSDKVWIAEKILNKNQAVKWSVLCAESVVHMFEDKHPNDRYISDCIRYLKTVKDFNSLTNIEREEIKKHLGIIKKALPAYADYAAYHATCATTSATTSAADAVHYALYAAVYAAADAGEDADAVHYALYAAVYAAADAGEDADTAKQKQKELNIQFLKQVIND